MKIIQSLAVTALVLLFLCGSADALDGQRRGFTASFGMGMSPYVYSSNETFNYDITGAAMGMNLGIGWGIDNKNMVFGEIVVAAAMDYETNECGNRDNDPRSGIMGFNWYHYFSDRSSSWYSILGCGKYINTYDYSSRGLGFLLGGGYELGKHVQMSSYYYFGSKTTNGIEYKGRTLVFIITAVLY